MKGARERGCSSSSPRSRRVLLWLPDGAWGVMGVFRGLLDDGARRMLVEEVERGF